MPYWALEGCFAVTGSVKLEISLLDAIHVLVLNSLAILASEHVRFLMFRRREWLVLCMEPRSTANSGGRVYVIRYDLLMLYHIPTHRF
jgi:hypothetical protein